MKMFGETNYEIHGSVAPGYEAVQEEFESNFRRGLEDKAQCCAYVGPQKVVDLWGEVKRGNQEHQSTYDGDSLTMIFSSTKSVTAIVFATLIDSGLADYGDKVSTFWPEFGENGKENVTFESILRHESGLAKLNLDLTPESFFRDSIKRNVIGKQLLAHELNFPHPKHGTDRQYHSLSRGILLNEIFRRLEPSKRTIGEYLREEITNPLGADVFIGSLEQEEKQKVQRLASWSPQLVFFHTMWPKILGSKIEPNSYGYLGAIYRIYKMSKPRKIPWEEKPFYLYDFSIWSQDWSVMGELPSSCGIASARGLARLAAVMANGGSLDNFRLLKPKTWQLVHGEKTTKKDVAQNIPGISPITLTKGGLVYFTPLETDDDTSRAIRALRDGYFGWYGMGGSVFQWNPGLRIGFAYVPTLMAWYDVHNLRGARLQNKVAECAMRLEQVEGISTQPEVNLSLS